MALDTDLVASWPEPDADAGVDASGQDKARMRRARDMLIDCEDELLYVVGREPGLQKHIDAIVDVLMDLTHRVE